MKYFNKNLVSWFIFIFLFQSFLYASQQEIDDLNVDDIFNMSMKEMLQVVVTTAGKKKKILPIFPPVLLSLHVMISKNLDFLL